MSLSSRSSYKSTDASWVLARDGEVPSNAVRGGHEANGQIIYIARILTDNNHVIPGKLAPQYKQAYVSYGGREYSSRVYQVLTHPNPQELKWISTSGNQLPTGALQGGMNDDSPLFIGRAPFEGGLCCGKFEPSHSCLYLPWGERENCVQHKFEVLCLTHISE